MVELIDSVRSFLDARDLGAVGRALEGAFAPHGLGRHTYFTVRSPLVAVGKRPIVTNFPEQWVRRYIECDYDPIDPIIEVATHRLTPFSWTSVVKERRLTRRQARFMDEARECGLKEGITVPIYGLNGDMAVLSAVSGDDRIEVERYIEANRALLHMAALYAHEAVCRISGPAEGEAAHKLHPRELECLLWAAKGKTSWEIGQILKISEGTVNQYFNSAARKLAVNNRLHAVAKAIMLGIIHP